MLPENTHQETLLCDVRKILFRHHLPCCSNPTDRRNCDKIVRKVAVIVNVGPVVEVVARVCVVRLEAINEPVLDVAAHHVVTNQGLGLITLTFDQWGFDQGVPAPISAPPGVAGQEKAGSVITVWILIGLRLNRNPI